MTIGSDFESIELKVCLWARTNQLRLSGWNAGFQRANTLVVYFANMLG